MIYTVYTKTYSNIPTDMGEVLRYAGVSGEAICVESLAWECLSEADAVLEYKVCFSEFDIALTGDKADLGFMTTQSSALSKNLVGCDRIILFAATLGIGIDRLIAKYSSLSPTKALLLQAIGAERIESLCDAFCADISSMAKESGLKLKPRFSAGYGDFPLSAQKDIFRVLDCPRKIGLTLNESLLMSPSKSVTAIVGLCKDR